MAHWFIFTSAGGLTIAEGDTLTKAVASFRKLKQPHKGEIVGVIREAASMEAYTGARPAPVFGVICCTANRPAIDAVQS